MKQTYWLSFADPDAHQFLGVAVIDIDVDENLPPHECVRTAIRKAWTLGINPGGEVMFFRIDGDDHPEHARARIAPRNRLLSEWDLIELGMPRYRPK